VQAMPHRGSALQFGVVLIADAGRQEETQHSRDGGMVPRSGGSKFTRRAQPASAPFRRNSAAAAGGRKEHCGRHSSKSA
jgi:hypothetical protein